jgi:hypothetical protein
VTGDGWRPGAGPVFVFQAITGTTADPQLASAAPDVTGHFALPVTAPLAWPLGPITLDAYQRGTKVRRGSAPTAVFTVVAPPATTPTTTPPSTPVGPTTTAPTPSPTLTAAPTPITTTGPAPSHTSSVRPVAAAVLVTAAVLLGLVVAGTTIRPARPRRPPAAPHSVLVTVRTRPPDPAAAADTPNVPHHEIHLTTETDEGLVKVTQER